MGNGPKSRGADLTPEQMEKIEAVRRQARTPEARARQSANRAHYADRPDLAELIRRGEVEPDRIGTMGSLVAIHKALAQVRRAREAKGLSLSEVARRARMPLPALSRLENGKNPNFTFETLARYAAAVGLSLDIVVRDRDEPAADRDGPSTASDSTRELADVVDVLTTGVQRLAAIAKRPPASARPAG